MGDLNLPCLSYLSQHIGFGTLGMFVMFGVSKKKTSMLGTNRYGYEYNTGWWFQIFLFSPLFGEDSHFD